jgi:CheY-like chemotaxis protein
MAYGAVESHGGCLTIDSAVGKGTTVAVYLPEAGGASRHRTSAPQRRESVDAGHAGTALIVDDERSIRLATGKLLKRFGYEVQVARDGQEALQACRERGGHFSVVILDLVMPNMSGAETFHALRREFPELKILLASGYSNEESADELLAAGAAGFVQKPFSLQDLLNALESALG